ncbi:octopamine receptor beta-2R-like [Octopus vulgaris]|uniref:Octopamine receptor beta-2R-like n=1 Tax=Octopus vulgaris TaxID=6645 RepID=A0AA36FEX1_OCTVU|nr:octopamine receptor beta-2R-like [Octopus vulgaris]
MQINQTASRTNMADFANETYVEESSLDFLFIFRSIAMVAIMVCAVFGNFLVIISVYKFYRLRVLTNYFIVSLAFADLLVALMVMPFSASIEIMNGQWFFGRTMCDIFNANDVLFSTASILHLCCISMDRYIAIMYPLKYDSHMTRVRVLVMLVITWVSSVCISYIPVHSQLYTTKENVLELYNATNTCPFVVNTQYAVMSSFVSFWIPGAIMVCLYVKIYLEARRQEHAIQSTVMLHTNYHSGLLANGSRYTDTSEQRNERKRIKREHKAAKTLGIIMGAFLACFMPFFSWYVITNICQEACPYPPVLSSTLFWIGYFNSCLNPIIYAYFNRDFRNAFIKLLKLEKCRCFRQDSDVVHLNYATNISDHKDMTSVHLSVDTRRQPV